MHLQHFVFLQHQFLRAESSNEEEFEWSLIVLYVKGQTHQLLATE